MAATSPNPHLLINGRTALHVDRPSINPTGFTPLYQKIGFNYTQLRPDRLLDEARETADPVRLMRLFGITATTAIHYVRTAHPECFGIDPTQA